MNTSRNPTKKSANNFSIIIVFALLSLCAIGVLRTTLKNPLAPDSWLHFGVGRYVIDQKRIPTHSDLSIKKVEPVLEYVSHSWLADTLLYVSTATSIELGSFILLPFFILAHSFLLFDIGEFLRIRRSVRLVGIGIAILAVLPFWKLHPFILLPSLMLLLVDGYLRFKQIKTVTAFAMIATGIYLWANISGGFLFIPVAILIFCCLYEFITTKYILHKKPSFQLLTITIIGILATLLTPNGIRLWIYNVTVIGLIDSRKWYSTLAGALEAANTSSVKIAPPSLPYIITLVYILFVLISVGYLLSAHRKRIGSTLTPLLPFLPLLALPFLWIRFIPFAIITTIPIFFIISEFTISAIQKTAPLMLRYLTGVIFFFGACIIITLWIYPQDTLSIRPPKEQFDLIEKYYTSRVVLPSTDIVGYSYFRLYPTRGFIDAQDDLYDDHDKIALYSGYSAVTEQSMQPLMSEYEFSTIIVSKENDYLTGYFSTHPDWLLVYLDYNGVLFVKRATAAETLISTYGLPSLDLTIDLGVQKDRIDQAIDELTRFTKNAPQSTLALGQLATLYRAKGKLDLAEQTLYRIPDGNWNFVTMTELGRVKAAQGKCSEAEALFLTALSLRDERNVSKTTFDLAILYAICLHDEEKAKHYFKRYTSYPIPPYERERATEIMKKYILKIDE